LARVFFKGLKNLKGLKDFKVFKDLKKAVCASLAVRGKDGLCTLPSLVGRGRGRGIKKCENQKKDKKIPFTFENKWGIISVLQNLLFKITRVRVLSLSLSLSLTLFR
jgi:hypothetical protein